MKRSSSIVVGGVCVAAVLCSLFLGARAQAAGEVARGASEFNSHFQSDFGHPEVTLVLTNGKTYRGKAQNVEKDYVGFRQSTGKLVWIPLAAVVAVEE